MTATLKVSRLLCPSETEQATLAVTLTPGMFKGSLVLLQEHFWFISRS